MFEPSYKHPLFNAKERENYRERWTDSSTGQETASRVLALIKQGAPEEFLRTPFYQRELPILENCDDLRGFCFDQIVQDFGGNGAGSNFAGVDFTYSEFRHCHFRNAVFFSSSLRFVRLYNCTFERCVFAFTSFLGAQVEKCRFTACDFPEACSFENVEVRNSVFDECFLGETTPFRDCCFDDLTSVQNMNMRSYRHNMTSTSKAALAGYYASFQSAYEASGADEKASRYFWEGRKAFTRHNSDCWGKVVGMVNELLTGYGVRPARPLIAMLLLYVIAAILWTSVMPPRESMLFTAGALLTFGARSECLDHLGYWARIAYVGLAFFGIAFSALFVTTLANLWFRQRVPSRTIEPRSLPSTHVSKHCE